MPTQTQTPALPESAIEEICLRHGYRKKEQPDGTLALNPYVFAAAQEIARAALASQSAQASGVALQKLAGLKSFLSGYRGSGSAKRNQFEPVIDGWLEGLSDLFATPQPTPSQTEPRYKGVSPEESALIESYSSSRFGKNVDGTIS